jgi:hypothetical protein
MAVCRRKQYEVVPCGFRVSYFRPYPLSPTRPMQSIPPSMASRNRFARPRAHFHSHFDSHVRTYNDVTPTGVAYTPAEFRCVVIAQRRHLPGVPNHPYVRISYSMNRRSRATRAVFFATFVLLRFVDQE